jgi:hypothetical protein
VRRPDVVMGRPMLVADEPARPVMHRVASGGPRPQRACPRCAIIIYCADTSVCQHCAPWAAYYARHGIAESRGIGANVVAIAVFAMAVLAALEAIR